MTPEEPADESEWEFRTEWPLTEPPAAVVRGESVPPESDQDTDQPTADGARAGER